MHCFSSEKLFRFEAIANVEHLPLPWPEDSFEAGIPPLSVATIANGVDTSTIFADLIRGLHLWYVISGIRTASVLTLTGALLYQLSDRKKPIAILASGRFSKWRLRFQTGGAKFPIVSNLTLLPYGL